MKRSLLRLGLLLAILSLAACHRGGGGGANSSSAPSGDAFMGAVAGVMGATSETTEPRSIDGVAVTGSETAEPGVI